MNHYTPMQWVKISLANYYGKDKISFDDRIAFIDEAIKNNKLKDMCKDADEPNMFLSGVRAYEDIMQGKPVGYKIGLDATSSGPQVVGIQTGDESCCKLCNVIPTGERNDLYTIFYNKMIELDPKLPKNISRLSVKQGIMTSLYGSKSIPKKTFGEKYVPLFEHVFEMLMPNAFNLTNYLLEHWDSKATEYSWVMPDNFHVNFKVEKLVAQEFNFRDSRMIAQFKINCPTEKGRSLGANTAHSMDSLIAREGVRRCNILPLLKPRIERVLDGKESVSFIGDLESCKLLPELIKNYEDTGFFSTRILECINPLTLDMFDETLVKKCREVLDTIEYNPYKILCVHDCFFTHPNNVEYMRKSITLAYAELAKSTVLDHILESIIPNNTFVCNKISDLDKLIMESDYIIC